MSDFEFTVADGMVVGIAYELSLDDGDVVDEATANDSFEYLHGQGNIITGLETSLYGMKIGDTKEIVVAPVDGYGEADPEAFVVVPFDAFPDDMELSEGLVLTMRERESDRPVEAVVYEVRDDGVLMDLNHPLAGETLHFHIEVLSLRPATSGELSHGHAHGDGHSH